MTMIHNAAKPALAPRMVVAMSSPDPTMEADLGLALARAGRPREAQALLERPPSAAGTQPDLADSRVLHATSVAARLAGVPVDALRFGQLALERTPPERSADILRMRALTAMGLAWLDLGKPDEAIEALARALRMSRALQSHASPDRTDILVGLGRAEIALGRSAAARPLLAEADRFWREFAAQ